MADLQIPERYRSGISLLANLPDSSYQEILDAIKRAPGQFKDNRELATWVASEIKTIAASDVSKIIDSLAALYRVRSRTGAPLQKLAADVLSAAQEATPGFKVAAGVNFENRLAAFLDLEALNLISVKAKELQFESERTFCSARIITDVRPIFGDSATQPPSAMFIAHTLRIGFHDSVPSTHKEFFVALDAADISTLKQILERAEQKAATLKKDLDSKGFKTIDL